MAQDRLIVEKVTPEVDRRGVFATTYQMRNPFRQFADGVATELEVYSYFSHQAAAAYCPENGLVLDVCCGRGHLIPFLRYHAHPVGYVGVDIRPQNARWREGVDPRGSERPAPDWGFPVTFVEAPVGSMTGPVLEVTGDKRFHLVVYTAAIEHMQPSEQEASLRCCGELARPGATLYLTFPVTRGKDGYETQYDAHVYEPSEGEVVDWLHRGGWRVVRRDGWLVKATSFRERLTERGSREWAEYLYSTLPRPLALVTIAALFPGIADEVAYVCVKEA